MKRIIIAGVILIITVMLNGFSEVTIENYCDNIKKDLNKAAACIEKEEFEKAKEIIKNSKNDKSPIPYIYNLDFKKIKKELDDAQNLLKLKKTEYAKICIMRAISYANDIYDEYSLKSSCKL